MAHQSGITGIGVTDHVYIEFDLIDGVDLATAVAKLAEAINVPTTAGANIVAGVRPELWARVAEAADVPDNVHGFNEAIVGRDGYTMPATQHDVWLWVASSSRSAAFDLSRSIIEQLREVLAVADETVGWVYQHNRDLTGFEDGTENPGALEAPSVVAIPAGQPGAGASILLYQLWKHKTVDWESLGTKAQENIIGRTREDSTELDDDVMPDDSHVSRNVIEVDGEELEIFRRNTAYGDHNDHGTVFVGFSFDQWRMEEMLRRMAGADDEQGPRDALTRFTDAISGSWYVCPSVEALAKLLPEED